MAKEIEIFSDDEEDLKILDSKLEEPSDNEDIDNDNPSSSSEETPPATQSPKKGRGRPKKITKGADPEGAEEEPAKLTKKGNRKRGPVSEKQRQINIDNLARGRAKALETRRKNAALRKLEREEKMSAQEEKLRLALEKKKERHSGTDKLKSEIAELKKKLAALSIKEHPPQEKKEKPTPKAQTPKAEAPAPAPTPKAPTPNPRKPLSNRDLLKLMRKVRR